LKRPQAKALSKAYDGRLHLKLPKASKDDDDDDVSVLCLNN
jgi:hypothetical protein